MNIHDVFSCVHDYWMRIKKNELPDRDIIGNEIISNLLMESYHPANTPEPPKQGSGSLKITGRLTTPVLKLLQI